MLKSSHLSRAHSYLDHASKASLVDNSNKHLSKSNEKMLYSNQQLSESNEYVVNRMKKRIEIAEIFNKFDSIFQNRMIIFMIEPKT